jgi:S-adenosylmethionine:tRNA ribosyltransferase-isomerase
LRSLETLYWMGLKTILNPQISYTGLTITQWQVYDELEDKSKGISSTEALTALQHWMAANNTETLIIKTEILIAPGYNFKIAKGLVTNFHQPQSTLLLLVAALSNNYRFLSYGDSCLLMP